MDDIVKIIGEEAHRNKTMLRNEIKYAEVISMQKKLKKLLDECNADYSIEILMDEVFHTSLVIKIITSNLDVAPMLYSEYQDVINKGNSIGQNILSDGKMEIEIVIQNVYVEIPKQ